MGASNRQQFHRRQPGRVGTPLRKLVRAETLGRRSSVPPYRISRRVPRGFTRIRQGISLMACKHPRDLAYGD